MTIIIAKVVLVVLCCASCDTAGYAEKSGAFRSCYILRMVGLGIGLLAAFL